MKKNELNSVSFKIDVGTHQDLYTTHEVTFKNNREFIQLWKKWEKTGEKIKKYMKRSGIIFGENLEVAEQPLITYTSRCKEKILLEDFYGRIRIGNNVIFHSTPIYPMPKTIVRLNIVQTAPDKIGEIIIGDKNLLPGISIISYEKVSIANNVMFGPNVILMDCSGHALDRRGEPDELQRLKSAPIIIEEGAWIGYGAVILKGVRIGKNSVVGINSVVHESVPDNTVVAGNPAKVVKTLS